jgi:hypothetical protein
VTISHPLELVERLRFRLRPVRESTVEAEDEGTTIPVTADVDDCAGSEDEEVPTLDNSDDDDANVDVLDD